MRAAFVEHPVERSIADLAARQHGVVARSQLAALGFTRGALARRVAAGRLHRIHHGVYAVGHPILTRHGHWLAAVLACGPTAALSHTSAAALWEIRPTDAARIDVTVPSAGGRARPGLRIHRTPTLRPDEITHHHAIAVTTPTRTLLDLAATLPRRALEKALDQAEIHQLFDLTALDAIARAHARRHGAARLQDALASHRAGTTAFERDRHRDAILAQAGYRVLRFSHRQVTREPAQVAAALRSSA